MITCRYTCAAHKTKCCFECDQVPNNKPCQEGVCSKPCYLVTGEPVPRIIKQYE